MTQTRVLLLCLLVPAVLGGWLRAQEKIDPKGEVEISFVVEPDQETHWEASREVNPDGSPGPFVIVLPFAVKLTYEDAPGRDQRKLLLFADRAVLWFEPGDGADDKETADDPFMALASGAKNLQFYGEGNLWMRYSVGINSVTMRSDRLFLDFVRSKIVSYDAKGNPIEDELLNLRGRASNPRVHSSAEDFRDAPGGSPIRAAVRTGATEATGEDGKDVGASPSDDAIPQPFGAPKSLPQEQGRRLFARADELRFFLTQDLQEVDLENGSVSSSSLAVASYSLAAEHLTIRLTKTRSTVYMTRPAVRVLDTPLVILPVEDYAYDVDSQPPIRQLDFITSSAFGFAFRTYIDAIATYDFFADPEPPFYPLHLGPQIDYYTKRGLGLGVNMDWGFIRPFDDFGAAFFRSLYINDPGDKRSRAEDLGWYPVEKHSRGRMWGAYSQNFGDGWQLDHLLNYSSDENFREEFYENEFDNNEPENSFIQLTKRYQNLNFFLLLEPKVHPWHSKTEYLPTLGFDTTRVMLGDFGLQFSSHTEASVLRFMPGDGDERESISTLRADSTLGFNLPLELGPFAIDPFLGTRFTLATSHLKFPEDASRPGLSADNTFPGFRPGDQHQNGILYRFLPFFGINLQTFFTGTFNDVRIPGLAIDGLRHVIAPFVRYTNVIYNSLDEIPGRGFIPMDGIDVLDEEHEIRFGIRNRVQTRQGSNEDRQTVDYFEIMAEIPMYPQRQRDNGGNLFGDLEIAATWRPAPGFALSGNMFIDPRTGNFNRAAAEFRFDILNVADVSIYYRLLKGQHQVVGIAGDLAVSELYNIGFRQEYDLEQGKFRNTRISLTRRVLEAFDLNFVFLRDAVDGDIGFQVSLSLAFRAPSSGAGLLR
jgi:hypothetical protein